MDSYQKSIEHALFELRDLERFIAIVEHRNFGRAAAALGIAQPALSRRIGALERNLGAPLFSRARRQIELTPLGDVLVREARAVLAQAAVAGRVLRGAVRGAAGLLRIGTRSSSRYMLIPAAIRALRTSHPEIVVTLTDPLVGRQMEYLRNGTCDMTLVRGPVNLSGGLRSEHLRSDPLVVALPERHPLAARDVVEVRDLVNEPFVEIVWYEAFGYKELVRGVCAREGFVPRVVQEVDTPETLAMSVAAGSGIAIMHDAGRELPIPGIAYRPIDPPQPPVVLQAVWRGDDPNPLIAPFLDALVAAATSGGPSLKGPPLSPRALPIGPR
jgi:DNA-binding transcriptional LysR family regulator